MNKLELMKHYTDFLDRVEVPYSLYLTEFRVTIKDTEYTFQDEHIFKENMSEQLGFFFTGSEELNKITYDKFLDDIKLQEKIYNIFKTKVYNKYSVVDICIPFYFHNIDDKSSHISFIYKDKTIFKINVFYDNSEFYLKKKYLNINVYDIDNEELKSKVSDIIQYNINILEKKIEMKKEIEYINSQSFKRIVSISGFLKNN